MADTAEAAAGAEPLRAHEDSRRLLGPNLYLPDPAVVLTPCGTAAADAVALQGWAGRVEALCAALHWPPPRPQVQGRAPAQALAFAAPEDLLFTATEVNEWAWERSRVAAARADDEGFEPTQPTADGAATVAPLFAARAAAERSAPLARLRAAAERRGLPVFVDDDAVSVGAGRGSVAWPRAALPLPMDVPWARLHGVPTLLVTGSNGKTTTARLLAAIATRAGLKAGLCSTEGVVVEGQTVLEGDYAGPAGARAVLRHPAVGCAVLETARGGLLRRGLALRRADAAVVTNVAADHLGEYGVADVADIAAIKLVVAQAVTASGTLVLNAADTVLMAVAGRTPAVVALRAAGRLALFARDHGHPALTALRAAAGATAGVSEGRLLLTLAGVCTDLGPVATMPLALGGAAAHNVENIAAAALAAAAAGLPLDAIGTTLAQFGSRAEDNPGRLERHDFHGATVLVDYAHNPDGLAQLLQVARTLVPRGRLGLLLGQAGNRDDAAIGDLARTAAGFAPERIVVKELPGMLRGRPPGQVPGLIVDALCAAGQAAASVVRIDDEEAAARALLDWAAPGDTVVLPVHTAAVRRRLGLALRD